jgi:hypothetical protein
MTPFLSTINSHIPMARKKASQHPKANTRSPPLDHIIVIDPESTLESAPPSLPRSLSPLPQDLDHDEINPLDKDEEDGASSITADNTRIIWSAEMLEALIEFILECHRDGKTSGSGMKKDLWHLAAMRVNRVTHGYMISWDKCKNKWGSDIKEKWKHWVMLSEMSGFGWNEEKELYEAYDYVWDNLNKSQPRIIWHKTHIMYHREELSEILHDTQATGQGAVSGLGSHQLVLDPRLRQIDTDTQASIASRSSSPTSQLKPKTPYNRSKKRVSTEISNDNTLETLTIKRVDIKRGEQKVDLGLAISGLSATMERAIEEKKTHKTDSQKAVELLELAYGNRLDMMEFIEGCAFFKDEKNAGIFLSITNLARRDRWLEINLHVELKEDSEEVVF